MLEELELRVRREQLEEVVLGRRRAPIRLGRFELRERLGAGGMGTVFAAHDPELDRCVALKVLRDDLPQERLREEARVLARLSHPHVVPVHEVGVHEGRTFVVMERVEGDSLARWLHAQPRPWEVVLRAFVAAGRGLAAAHDVGVVHRDFKPDNVLVDGNDHVRVADFGLAQRETGEVESAASSRSDGSRVTSASGTPCYLAPEVLDGRPATAASDQYAFCIAAREALADAVPPPPRRVRLTLDRGLAPSPGDRWPSMHALLGELDRALGHRRWWPAAIVGTIATGGVAIAIVLAHDDPCDAGAQTLADAWPGTLRGALEDPVAEELDAYTERWASTYRSACRAGGEAPDPQIGVCLDSRLRTFTRLAALLGERGLSPNARIAALSLPAVEECAMPPNTDGRDTDYAIELAIAEANASAIVGRHPEALAAFDEATEQARQSGRRLSLAHALIEGGFLRTFLDRRDEATARLEEAFWIAHEDEFHSEASRAAALLAFASAAWDEDHGRGEFWGRLAIVAARRRGVPPSVLANALGKQALVAKAADRPEEAIALCDEALAILDRVPSPSPLAVHEIGARRGVALLEAGRAEEAVAALRGIVASSRETYGNDHPNVAFGLDNLGTALREAGRLAEAEDAIREAARCVEDGHLRAFHAELELRLSDVLRRQGRFDEAIELATRSLARLTELQGGELEVAMAHAIVAAIELDRSNIDAAREHAERSLALYDAKLPDSGAHIELLDPLDVLARVHARSGRLAEGEAARSRAESIANALPPALRDRALRELREGT